MGTDTDTDTHTHTHRHTQTHTDTRTHRHTGTQTHRHTYTHTHTHITYTYLHIHTHTHIHIHIHACTHTRTHTHHTPHTTHHTHTPYVGSVPAHEHIQCLRDSIEIAQATAAKYKIHALCFMGDFNLRGVAPGRSAPPPRGSGHESLSQEFIGILQAAGPSPLRTPATHSRGGALDIHFNNTLPEAGIVLHEPPPELPSDHMISSIAVLQSCPSPSQPTATGSPLLRQLRVYKWCQDQAQWKSAWRQFTPLCNSISATFHYVAATATTAAPPKCLRCGIAQSTDVLINTVCSMAGSSAAGLLITRGSEVSSSRINRKSARNAHQHMLTEMALALDAARAAARTSPSDTMLQAIAECQERWLEISSLAAPRPQPLLHRSWLQALQQGNVALQRWLSSTSRLPPPRIPMESHTDATSLMAFRSQVGHLDPRCDDTAESTALAETTAQLSRHSARVVEGLAQPWIAAPSAQHLCCPNTDSNPLHARAMFVAASTVSALITKRSNPTASAILPWSAMRALAALGGPHLGQIHGALECTWALVDMADESLAVEIEHAQKGQQKPVDKHASYRPLGLAYPLFSLRSDLLRLRIAPGLTSVAGSIQVRRSERCLSSYSGTTRGCSEEEEVHESAKLRAQQ